MSTQTATASDAQHHNPASTWLNLRNFALVLVIFGLFVSGYLSYVKLTDVAMACPGAGEGGFNCDVVQNSIYSEFPIRSGIAIAWLGFGTYVVIGLMILFERHIAFLNKWGVPIKRGVVTDITYRLHTVLGDMILPLTFGIITFAFLFSMYLVYVQAVLLKAFCVWCLMHEANMTVLFVVYIGRLILFLNKPDVVDET